MQKPRKILVVRTDRLGDVLLSLPVLEYLRAEFPSDHLHFLCRSNILPVITPYLNSKEIKGLECDRAGERWKISRSELKEYDGILFLYATGLMMFEAWRARVPLRVGIRSKPASFFWLSHGLGQHRSLAEKNEGEYNLEVAQAMAARLGGSARVPKKVAIDLVGDEMSRMRAKRALEELRIREMDHFVVFHPGMGGSAENLTKDDYVALIQRVRRESGLPVVLSVGPTPKDHELAFFIFQQIREIRILTGLELSVLREVLRKASVVVAPSTGPLHLAHLVGANTIGFYSPVQSQHPNRWAPWGGKGKSLVLFPQIACPGTKKCIGNRCEHYYCMTRLDWGSLILNQENDLMRSS